MTIFAPPFALIDADDHTSTVDISGFEMNHFVGTQARSVGDRQGCLVINATVPLDQLRHFVAAEYLRDPARFTNGLGLTENLWDGQGYIEKNVTRK